MLTGKRFQLLAETLGVEGGDSRVTVSVPAGEIITILSGPRPDDKRLVDVRWRNKKLMMFFEDIQKRGNLTGNPA
jgi:hypothetical protein